jgi:AcrR family transcriptional regulator
MTSATNQANRRRRPRDSEATRRALLEAGRSLFDEVGYDRATTREIGQRAGVDAALIARYFGGKEGLFLAVIAEGPAGGRRAPEDFEPKALLAYLLERWDERGHGPVSRALASPTLSDGIRGEVRAMIGERLVEPLVAELKGSGCSQLELRAELLVALALGVAVTRANGTLAVLADAPREEVVALLGPVADVLSGES